MTRYWLAAHAYLAVVGPQTIFFDSRRRMFCALRSSCVYSLRSIVDDWGMPETQYDEADASPLLDDHAAFLAKRGLLTTVRAEGKKMEQLQIEEPQYSLVDPADIPHTRAKLTRATRILYSGLLTTWRIRHRTFDEVLLELARGKRMHDENRVATCPQQVAQLVSFYWRFRPLLPLQRHTDLADSLTLIEYLSSYLSFPSLVIGVRLLPFTTHVWVQDGNTVFNDSPEFVRQFTPIFST